MDHRPPKSDDPEIQFEKQHEVYLTEDGKLNKLAGADSIEVNSLHTQGIDKLADSLEIEGVAKDETVEATVSYTHLRAPRDLSTSRMPSSA